MVTCRRVWLIVNLTKHKLTNSQTQVLCYGERGRVSEFVGHKRKDLSEHTHAAGLAGT
jgi:hypothetical protein